MVSDLAIAQVPMTEREQSSWWVNIGLNHTGEISVNVHQALLWGVRAAYVGDMGVVGSGSSNGPPSWNVGLLVGDEWHNN